MGYYVHVHECNFKMKKENYDEAYNAACAINANDGIKRGGCYGGTATPKPADSQSVASTPDKWFSWMPWNYDEIYNNIIEVLECLGFEVEEDNEGICQLWYDDKTGQEDLFFETIAPYVEDGSYLVWRGEDDTYWVFEFANGQMYEKNAQITITW